MTLINQISIDGKFYFYWGGEVLCAYCALIQPIRFVRSSDGSVMGFELGDPKKYSSHENDCVQKEPNDKA